MSASDLKRALRVPFPGALVPISVLALFPLGLITAQPPVDELLRSRATLLAIAFVFATAPGWVGFLLIAVLIPKLEYRKLLGIARRSPRSISIPVRVEPGHRLRREYGAWVTRNERAFGVLQVSEGRVELFQADGGSLVWSSSLDALRRTESVDLRWAIKGSTRLLLLDDGGSDPVLLPVYEDDCEVFTDTQSFMAALMPSPRRDSEG